MRNHTPLPIKDFNGLWARGDSDSCPPDHFTDCNNVVYEQSSVKTRDHFASQYGGIGTAMLRQKIYVTNVGGTQTVFLMMLTLAHNFYYQKISPIPDATPTLLSGGVPGSPIDFDLVNFNGIAYITFSYATVGVSLVRATPAGILYLFNGTTFRPAGGLAPQTFLTATPAGGGVIDVGLHAIGLSYETDTGFITPMNISDLGGAIVAGTQTLNLTGIPLGPAGTAARRIYFSKVITGSIDPTLQTYYFVGRIPDNTTTTFTLNVPDSALLEDDTYLLFIPDYIPAGLGVGKYHNRLVIWGFPQETIVLSILNGVPPGINPININLTASTILFSNVNDPETFNLITGFTIIDGNAVGSVIDSESNALQVGVTICQEYRDLCYAFKLTKTFVFTDNGSDPSTWTVTIIDEGSGAFVKGVATVLDSNGVNYEYLIISNITGMYTFNGLFVRPEITYKIADLWKLMNKTPQASVPVTLARNSFHTVLDTINKQIYILTKFATDANLLNTPYSMLICDFANSFIGDPNFSQAARWSKWNFDQITNTFTPNTLVGYDTGKGLQLIANNGNLLSGSIGVTFAYEGTGGTIESLPTPFIQTYMLTDDENDIIHLGGIRFRINTQGAAAAYVGPWKLSTFAINEDNTLTVQFADITILANPGKNPFLITNFVSQKFMIKIQVPNDGFFNLNDMIAYVKPMYTSFAQ